MAGHINVGLNCHTYFNTGNYGTPVWTEITVIGDASLALEFDKAEAKSRASKYIMTLPTLAKGPLSFKMLHDTTQTYFDTLKGNWINNTVCDMAFADGLIAGAGTEYWRADYYIYKWNDDQPLEEFETVDVEMDLAYSVNPQAFITVGS